MTPFTVVIYGAVGVGKSSVVKALVSSASRRRQSTNAAALVYGIREPTEALVDSGALDDVYENRTSSGYRLQMLVLAERMSTYWQMAAELSRTESDVPSAHIASSPAPMVIFDGHIGLDDDIFVDEHVRNGRMSRAECNSYVCAAHIMLAQCPAFAQQPNMYVYLRGDAQTCAQRAAKRGRVEESALDTAFFARMVAACDAVTKVLATQNSTIVVTINSDDVSLVDVCDAVRNAINVHYRAAGAEQDMTLPTARFADIL